MSNIWFIFTLFLFLTFQNCSLKDYDFRYYAPYTTFGINLLITHDNCYFSQPTYFGSIAGDGAKSFTNLKGITKNDIVNYSSEFSTFAIYSTSTIEKGSAVGFTIYLCCQPTQDSVIMAYKAYVGTAFIYSGEVPIEANSASGWSVIADMILLLLLIA